MRTIGCALLVVATACGDAGGTPPEPEAELPRVEGSFEGNRLPVVLLVLDESASMLRCTGAPSAGAGSCDADGDGSAEAPGESRLEVARRELTSIAERWSGAAALGLVVTGASSCGAAAELLAPLLPPESCVPSTPAALPARLAVGGGVAGGEGSLATALVAAGALLDAAGIDGRSRETVLVVASDGEEDDCGVEEAAAVAARLGATGARLVLAAAAPGEAEAERLRAVAAAAGPYDGWFSGFQLADAVEGLFSIADSPCNFELPVPSCDPAQISVSLRFRDDCGKDVTVRPACREDPSLPEGFAYEEGSPNKIRPSWDLCEQLVGGYDTRIDILIEMPEVACGVGANGQPLEARCAPAGG